MATKIYDLDTNRRNAILNAALKEFVLRGYDNASTNIIAKEAGISKPLMFHYIGSKQDLFLYVYDYFAELLNKEYYQLIDYDESDIFNRLHQSLLLQIKLLKEFPWVFEFNKLSAGTQSEYINSELEKRNSRKYAECYPAIFDAIDTSGFREELDIEKCKQIILWSCVGFSNQMLESIRNTKYSRLDYQSMEKALNDLLTQLRKIFYRIEK
ncbi:TetR/AcrR family transcriptional regulator [Robinsoniella peoriensis]